MDYFSCVDLPEKHAKKDLLPLAMARHHNNIMMTNDHTFFARRREGFVHKNRPYGKRAFWYSSDCALRTGVNIATGVENIHLFLHVFFVNVGSKINSIFGRLSLAPS